MGAGQSQPSDRKPSKGLHVLRVTPSSPASQTDLEPFFDFVVGLEDSPFSSDIDASALEKIVESNEGKPLNLLVWSSKTQESRLVPVTPSRLWSSRDDNGEPHNQPSLLGLSMRLCEPEFALDNVWHVLDVLEGSPAESAGLVPYGDWIVGWSGGVLHAEGDFYEVVEAHVDKPLRVYVYSYDFDTLREVVLVPNRQWGGEGLLGCVFGFGLLHRIPAVIQTEEERDRLKSPRASLEEYEEQQLFVPADAHANTVFNTTGATESSEWMRYDTTRTSSPNQHGTLPTLVLNGAKFNGDITAVNPELREPMQTDPIGNEEDEDERSLEDTTGSITSVD